MITKKEFDLLYSDKITKKQYDLIIKKIDKRFEEICKKFVIKLYKDSSWYDYDTCYGENGFVKGYFDPNLYKEYISIDGLYIQPPAGYDCLEIPTRWLWESGWETEIKNKKQNLLKLKKKSIKSKLTPEELEIISFK